MKRKLKPIQLKPMPGTREAWAYVNARSIEVFIFYEQGKNPVSAKIMASQLEKLLGKKL